MPTLVLLNGPPASGKSTLARRWTDQRPLALDLDIDMVRSLLGGWIERPAAAGVNARRLALAMARTHLESGYDVIVPQLLARAEFIDELALLADQLGVRFVEIALTVDLATSLATFERRSLDPQGQTHRDAADLIDRGGNRTTQIERIHEQLSELIDSRPATRRVEVVPDDIDDTMARLVAAIDDP